MAKNFELNYEEYLFSATPVPVRQFLSCEGNRDHRRL